MRKLIMAGFLVAVVLLASLSCASSANVPRPAPTITAPAANSGPYYSGSNPGQSVPTSAPAPPATTTTPIYRPADSSSSLPSLANRMVVRTGDIDIVVSDIAAAIDNITRIAADFGGYVVTSQKWKEGQRNIGSISIRILADNYDKAVAAVRALAMSVNRETNSTQDVTEEYTDLDSRVKNLEATEAQLQKIMETATKTEDVLSIQRELTNVRGEIEQAKGRMQYLERTSSTSLIQISLSEAILDLKFNASKVRADVDEPISFTSVVAGGFAPYSYIWDFGDGATSVEKSPHHSYRNPGTYTVLLTVTDDKGYTNSITRNDYINIIGTWNPGSVARSAWNGLAAFGRVFVNVLIWLGIFSPLWIVIGFIVWWTVYRKRKRAKNHPPTSGQMPNKPGGQ